MDNFLQESQRFSILPAELSVRHDVAHTTKTIIFLHVADIAGPKLLGFPLQPPPETPLARYLPQMVPLPH